MRLHMKKGLAFILTAAMISQSALITVQAGTNPVFRQGLYLDGRLVKDGDTVGEHAVFQWKTAVSFSGEEEDVYIPERKL